MRHLLSLEAMERSELERILRDAPQFKQARNTHPKPLTGQTWAMIFSKSSTRTRVSFEVGITEMGGKSLFLNASEIQLGRGEPIRDTARVLGRMVHGAIIRTFAQSDVIEFALKSGIPTINALTDAEHPCQILTDIFTFEEKKGPIAGRTVAFIGDGASNVAASWVFAAQKLEFELRIAAPNGYQPPTQLLERAKVSARDGVEARGSDQRKGAGRILVTDDLNAAVAGADLLYTDVWVSMGKEAESATRLRAMAGYQINAELVNRAGPGALVMHCLPAYRGKEIDDETFESHARTIFDQAENRLHVQKSILNWLVS